MALARKGSMRIPLGDKTMAEKNKCFLNIGAEIVIFQDN